MGKAEKQVEAHFKQGAIDRGGFTRKYVSPGRRGVPDRILFLGGLVVFAELKTPVGQLSRHQVEELRRMTDQGAVVVMLASIEEVDAFYEAIDDGLRGEPAEVFDINLDLLEPINAKPKSDA